MIKRPSPPSARDVARLAGVSQAAVSRAFTPGASVAKDTQEKIFRIAKTVGYRPNLHARSLIKGMSNIVGVVIGNSRNSVFMKALDSLSVRLSMAGMHMLVFTAEGRAAADMHVDGLLKYRVDALLLMGTHMSPSLARQCRSEGIRVIALSRPPKDVEYFSSVSANNKEGARQIAAHLLQQGYRRLAFIRGRETSLTSRERETSFVSYLHSEGATAPVSEVGNFQRESTFEATRRLLLRKARPDAIFCANDYMALAAIEVARYEFGLDIGSQIGIAGFDDVEASSWRTYDLTTYSMPLGEMVEHVVKVLMEEPRKKKPPGHTVVDGNLKPRMSTQRTRR
jgi:DNA-binding LacI/PurR family transcriptional regulator